MAAIPGTTPTGWNSWIPGALTAVVLATVMASTLTPGALLAPSATTVLGAGLSFALNGTRSIAVFNATGNVTVELTGEWVSTQPVQFEIWFTGERTTCPPEGCSPPPAANRGVINSTIDFCAGSPQCGSIWSVDWSYYHFVTLHLTWNASTNETATVTITAAVLEEYSTP
jgi:hypothetical protein